MGTGILEVAEALQGYVRLFPETAQQIDIIDAWCYSFASTTRGAMLLTLFPLWGVSGCRNEVFGLLAMDWGPRKRRFLTRLHKEANKQARERHRERDACCLLPEEASSSGGWPR